MKIDWKSFWKDVAMVVTMPLWIIPAIALSAFLWLYFLFLQRYEK